MSSEPFPDDFPDALPGSIDDLMEVAIANEQSRLMVDEDLLASAAQRILKDADYLYGELSIAIVDDPTIHQLNRDYLQHDYPTDVLSFLLEEQENRLIGQVILSVDTAEREANQIGWSVATEMLLYVVHGTLHLVGYDDLDDENRGEMRRAERRYLMDCGVPEEQIDARLPSAFVDSDRTFQQDMNATADDSPEDDRSTQKGSPKEASE